MSRSIVRVTPKTRFSQLQCWDTLQRWLNSSKVFISRYSRTSLIPTFPIRNPLRTRQLAPIFSDVFNAKDVWNLEPFIFRKPIQCEHFLSDQKVSSRKVLLYSIKKTSFHSTLFLWQRSIKTFLWNIKKWRTRFYNQVS